MAIVIDNTPILDWQGAVAAFDNNGTLAPVAAALPLPVQIGDGSHTALIKTTAPVSGDAALVVSLSPNSAPLPVSVTGGSNAQGTAAAITAPWPVELSDGTQLIGVTAHPVRTDPTGTTAQPVSGTVGIAGTVPVSVAATLPVSIAATVPVSIAATLPVSIAGTLPVSLAAHVTTDQGTAATVAGSWPVKITDGVNVMPAGDSAARAGYERLTDGVNTAAVKAASTAPVGTDPALVVALSPNSPTLPVSIAAAVPVTIAATLPVSIAATVATSLASIAASAAAADAVANPTAGILQSLNLGFNGATWDRLRTSLVGVQTTFAGILNTLGMGRYNAAGVTLADGNIAPLQVNTTGALKTVTNDVETAILDLTTTCSSSASTTTVSATVTGLSKMVAVSIEATLQGPTGGTLDVYLQHSPNAGTDWYDFAHYSQVAAAAAVTSQMYVPGINDKNTLVGKGTAGTPSVALAANSFVGGHPFDAMRMVMVTGAGVSLGKSQVVKLHVTQPKA